MGFDRSELDEMLKRWLQANRDCEAAGDWKSLADFYTEDATYGWNTGPTEEFMAMGREQIRDYALGTEMAGLENWTYGYQDIVVDAERGMVVGFWKQHSREPDPKTGQRYEIAGLGGSWFKYAGNFQWAWQRDWFDFGNAAYTFVAMMSAGDLSEGMVKRMHTDPADMPGHYPRESSPAPLWVLEEGRITND